MCALSASSTRYEAETRRFPVLVYVLAPLIALVLQAWLPRLLGSHVWFDLPLLITVYIALARRDPIQGMGAGVLLGLFEDALSHRAIGVNGIAKTVAGFLAASVGSRIDLENNAVRTLLILALSLLGSGIYLFVYRFLLGLDMEWNWLGEALRAVGNGVIAFFLFPLLDRTQLRD